MLRSTSVTVTSALATTAPLESNTSPVTLPVPICAKLMADVSMSAPTTTIRCERILRTAASVLASYTVPSCCGCCRCLLTSSLACQVTDVGTSRLARNCVSRRAARSCVWLDTRDIIGAFLPNSIYENVLLLYDGHRYAPRL